MAFPRQTECTIASGQGRKPGVHATNMQRRRLLHQIQTHKSNLQQYLGFFQQAGKLVETHANFAAVRRVISEPGDAHEKFSFSSKSHKFFSPRLTWSIMDVVVSLSTLVRAAVTGCSFNQTFNSDDSEMMFDFHSFKTELK